MKTITVLAIDESASFRADVSQSLSQQSDLKILEFAPTDNLMEIIEDNLPDVILLSTDITAFNSLDLSRIITRYYPNTRVVLISPDPSDEELFEVIKTAAVAYLNKNIAAKELESTIRMAYQGEYPINESLVTTPTVAKHVLKQFQEIASMGKAMKQTASPLTHRETQILICIANGITDRQIVYALRMSEKIVNNHVSAILRKLIANDRAQAVVSAIQNGLIPVIIA